MSSAHNWNTLFVGVNAVADAMAEKYGKSKGEILTQVLLPKSLLSSLFNCKVGSVCFLPEWYVKGP